MDPVAPIAGGPDLTQSVTVAFRLQRWEGPSVSWLTLETKEAMVDLAQQDGTPTGNTYGEIAPIRFATTTPRHGDATPSYAAYRVVARFTWTRNQDSVPLGSLTITPTEAVDVACARGTLHCSAEAFGGEGYLWAG